MKPLMIAILILCTVGSVFPAFGRGPNKTRELQNAYFRVIQTNKKLIAENTQHKKTIKSQAKEIATLKKDTIKLNLIKVKSFKHVAQNRLLVQYVKELRLFIRDKLGLEALDSIVPPRLRPTTKPSKTRPRTQPHS